jgi:hypothetical protein
VGKRFLWTTSSKRHLTTSRAPQEYLALLSQALDEAKHSAEFDIAREANSRIPRGRDALRLVLYKLEKLDQHIKTSRRLLNDLRMLRRLLLEERAEPIMSKHGMDSKL